MLCNKCQTRNATVHINICTGDSDDEPKKMDFCQECFEAADFKEKSALPINFEDTLRAGCRFCGGEFYSGGMDLAALLGGVRKMNVLCKPCSEEYHRFLSLKLPGLGEPDRTKEQIAGLVAKAGELPVIIAELEIHMKQWVAKRKSQ